MIYKVLPIQNNDYKELSEAFNAAVTPRIDGLASIQSANRRCINRQLRFCLGHFARTRFGMRVSITRALISFALALALPPSLLGQALPDQPVGAILHSQGGVWVNGYEARDSSAIFPGDVIETKTGATASLSLEGSTVLLAPESVGKFQADLLELDHGGVSVGTSKSFKVRVNCILVVPVVNEWTQYSVTDVNRTVHVASTKLDVNVEHEAGKGKATTPATTPAPETSSQRASVHEGEQKDFDESQVCGPAATPTSAAHGISPKWYALGALGLLALIPVIHGGGGVKPPVSPSAP